MLDKSRDHQANAGKVAGRAEETLGGRNAHGEITIWHRGGGHKKQYRSIDFRREKKGIPARVGGH